MKKINRLLLVAGLGGAAFLPRAFAETTITETAPQTDATHEFTRGGSSGSNSNLDDSYGALDFSYGRFASPRSEWLLRQSVSYTNPRNADNGWIASTRPAYDSHFADDSRTRPFPGVNGGRLCGNAVNDSWTAGLEDGAKFFMKSQTFVYTLVSYDWLFDRGNQIDDRFHDGRLNWSLGTGSQF